MPDELDPQTFGSQTDVTPPGPSAEPVSTADVGGGGGEPAAPAAFNLRTYLSDYGVDPNAFPDDRTAADTLRGAAEQYYQHRELIPQVQQYLAHQDKFQTWLSQQQAAEQEAQAKAQAAAKFQWESKKPDPRWDSLTRYDAQTGSWKAIAPDSQEALRAAQQRSEYGNWQRDTLQRVLSDFPKLAQESVADYVQTQIGQAVQQLQQNMQAQQAMAAIYQTNQPWLTAQDEQGQVQIDPRTGRPAFSELGQQYLGHLQNVGNMNLSDPRVQDWIAQRLAIADQNIAALQGGGAAPQGQPRQPPVQRGQAFVGNRPRGPDGQFLSAEQTGKQKQDRFLDRARGTRTGPNRDAATDSNEGDDLRSPKEMMLRELQKNGALAAHG